VQLSDQAPKSTKKQISVVWKYGKDIQSKCDAKKLATFAADVSDQREMDQGVHVPNSTEGAHHLRRWAFLWRCVVHNKKYVLLDISWICTGAPERQSWSSTLDWIEVRIQLHANPITSLDTILQLTLLSHSSGLISPYIQVPSFLISASSRLVSCFANRLPFRKVGIVY